MLDKGPEVPRGGHRWGTAARIIGEGVGEEILCLEAGGVPTKPGSGNKNVDIMAGGGDGHSLHCYHPPSSFGLLPAVPGCFSRENLERQGVTCKVAAEWK